MQEAEGFVDNLKDSMDIFQLNAKHTLKGKLKQDLLDLTRFSFNLNLKV